VVVLDLKDGELAQHTFVLRYLILLELVNTDEAVFDGDEVDEASVVVDAVASSLNVGLEGEL